MRAFSAQMFPDTVEVRRYDWSPGAVPGPKPSLRSTSTLAANVQAVSAESDVAFDVSDAMEGRNRYSVSFPDVDPGVSRNDEIVFDGMTLIAEGTAKRAARGRIWRLVASQIK